MPLTLKSISAELAKRGHTVTLQNGGGYFYFLGVDAANWLDRTVRVAKVSDLTLEEWIGEYEKLKERNEAIFRPAKGRRAVKAKTKT